MQNLYLDELLKRYSLSLGGLKKRMGMIGVTLIRDGRRKYVTGSDVEALDALDAKLKAGRGSDIVEADIVTETETDTDSAESVTYTDTRLVKREPDPPSSGVSVELLNLLAEAVADRLGSHSQGLQVYRDLEDAADHGWLIPTRMVAPLFGIHPSSLSGKQSFTRRGFTVTRVRKEGNEVLWRVSVSE